MSRLPSPGPVRAYLSPDGLVVTLRIAPPPAGANALIFHGPPNGPDTATTPTLDSSTTPPTLAIPLQAKAGLIVTWTEFSARGQQSKNGPEYEYLIPKPPGQKPPKPQPPSISLARPKGPSMSTPFIIDVTPSQAGPDIKKTSIIVTLNGGAQPAFDTTGAPIALTLNVGDVVTATETVTNTAGFTSDPSDPSPPFTVTDPTPSKPQPPVITLVGPAPVAPATPGGGGTAAVAGT